MLIFAKLTWAALTSAAVVLLEVATETAILNR
jgi:hypothetical protein